jgi:hypothetical protein
LAAAAKQGARLATTVLAFVALPGALAPEDLVAGILGLLPARGPARAPMQKFALRLALTMRYVEHLGSQARWRELFQPGTLLPEVGVIELHLRRWRAGEVLLAGTMLGATLILLLH